MLFYGDQPVGWDIAGSKKSVAAIKGKILFVAYLENYLSENITIAAAGTFGKEKFSPNSVVGFQFG